MDNKESRPCQLCGIHNHFFASQTYCVTCEVRIEKNAYYYCKSADKAEKEYCFCTNCYKKNSRSSYISCNGTSISKKLLHKKINDVVVEEPWVQCDKCKNWQHQVCALYTSKRDLEEDYLCPKCCLKEIENGVHVPSQKSNAAIFGAKDIPRTMLSEHIEQRLIKRLAQEREEKAKKEAKNLDEVLAAENLCVRVLSSVNKQLKVKKQFLDILSSENYPSEFNYGSKVIFLFQKIEGVDVCLFVMEVQEFGSDCGYPNQRSVYISYLDSVKYLRPEREAATGEPLRTFIYHEILIGYLDYCKKRGFVTCYIWSCPPKKGYDYILHCHPETQKVPKSGQLQNWYHSMLKKAAKENITVGLTNVYDRFFHPTKKCDYKVTVARLPYFDGDYWSSAAMDLFSEIKETEGKDIRKVEKLVTKATLKAMEHTNPSESTSKDALVMQKLGKQILPWKKNFIVVQLQQACKQCHQLIMSGKRWFCSECKEFQQCERCHSVDMHISVTKEKHALNHVLVDDIPFDTNDNDIMVENELLETRDKFLIFCQNNNFQFDTLRRAKYSSIMILLHSKNLLC
ncbi:putative histone acetyltransferase chromatin regulator PHD family [Lupinus albus]|uniref:histone acetyltransferase n=1 Tax=Lupinus albus TaxID=3870 RepID=A0A6A4QRZ5_LUPAL|nr:putative histone acetyltransferase chromatin regulator PHD family [Lupinus albus]